MSYVVTIKRDPPITERELHDLATGDPTLSVLSDAPEAIRGIVWRDNAGQPKMPLSFDDGSLWSTPRDDAELAKMQELAAKLHGRLLGEEGEELSGASPTAPSGCAGRAAKALVVVTLIAMAAAVA